MQKENKKGEKVLLKTEGDEDTLASLLITNTQLSFLRECGDFSFCKSVGSQVLC